MSLSVVPSSFQTPLVRPKRVDWTPGGLATHTKSMRRYDLAVARRFAYVTRGRYTYDDDDDDDVVVDVGGTGEAFVYPQVRRLEGEMEDENEGEEDEEEEREESRTRHFTHKYKSLSYDVLHKTMDDTCCFCLEEFTRVDAVTTDCGHSFCSTCFESYKKKTKCPCCRQSVVSLTMYCLTSKK